ncbi:cupin domain-containing protein [Candidatus Spongiihabitans sp.]|uniref:cupin domain-containing protein n=1 Tax=Candidatus Spongiihabitans sp. TaxID=3101308 RepID=UPI003C7ACD5B
MTAGPVKPKRRGSRAALAESPKFESAELLRQPLHGADNKEIILSLVTVPPGLTAPRHYHSGEEFAYVIEGTAISLFDDQDNEVVNAGEAAHIPYGIVHSVRADKGVVKALVVRIHDRGTPERTLVTD